MEPYKFESFFCPYKRCDRFKTVIKSNDCVNAIHFDVVYLLIMSVWFIFFCSFAPNPEVSSYCNIVIGFHLCI